MADEPLMIPAEVASAITTGRHELLKLAAPRDMTASEVAGLYAAISQLIEQYAALQKENNKLSRRIHTYRRHLEEVTEATTMASNSARMARLAVDRDGEN